MGPAGDREVQFFIAEEGASAVAYVVISVRGGAWVLEECGDRDPAGARVGAILQVLMARDPSALAAGDDRVAPGGLPAAADRECSASGRRRTS